MTRAFSTGPSRTLRWLTLGVSLAVSSSWPALAEEPAESPAEAAPTPAGVPDGESRFPIDDTNPTASIPAADQRSAHPLEYGYMLLEMTGRAESALEAKDFARAVRYFEALVVAVPEAAVGHRKLCMARSAAGDLEGAVMPCREATRSEGAQSGDLSRFLSALLARPTELNPTELAEFDEVLAHAEKEGVDPAEILPQSCTLAVRIHDDARLATCVTRLQEVAPGSANSASFAWALAMRTGSETAARKAFAEAQAAGHDAKKLAEMKVAMDRAYPSRTWIWGAFAAAAAAAVGAIFVARRGSKTQGPLPSGTPAA